jgi:hypothetical protein
MVLENFTDYGIFDNTSRMPLDEIVYQRMQESSNAIRRTDSGELYFDTVYSPRIPYKLVKSYDEYKEHNNLITHHKMLNDKKEMKENGILFFIREIFCCR